MLIIRLARIGRKNDPAFRVVVTEHTRGPKSGKHLEILGNYNPKMDDISIDGERVKYYISNGAQVSDTVHNILVGQGIIEGKKINVLPRKSPIIKEVEEGKEEVTTDSNTQESGATADEAKTEESKGEEAPKGDDSSQRIASDVSQDIMSTDQDVAQETTDSEASTKDEPTKEDILVEEPEVNEKGVPSETPKEKESEKEA